MKSWALAARPPPRSRRRWRQPPVADVVADRPAEEGRLLGDEADLLAEAGHRDVADVAAVDRG